MEPPTILGRIVRLPGWPGNDTSAQAIRAEDGCLPVGLPLSAAGFEPGDLIEIRLVRREGERGCRPKLPDQFGLPYGTPVSDAVRDAYLSGRKPPKPVVPAVAADDESDPFESE